MEALDVKTVLGAGEKTIGALVYWSLSGVDIPRAALLESLERVGLENALSKAPSKTARLSKAVAKTMVGRQAVLARRMAGGYAIVTESSEGSRLQHDHWMNVRPAEQGALDFIDPEEGEDLEDPGEIAQALLRHYLHAGDYMDGSDLSALLVRLMHGTSTANYLPAITLREATGGLYFVAAEGIQAVRELAAVVSKHNPTSRISVLTITGEHDNLAETAEAARRSFTGQLQAMKEELGELRAEGKVKAHSLRTRAKRFAALNDRVASFREILGDVADDLQKQTSEIRDGLLDELDDDGSSVE